MDRNPEYGHVTVTWKDYTIIWGGVRFDPSFVYYHLCGEWVWQKTSGDVPISTNIYGDVLKRCVYDTAVVNQDTMIVMGAKNHNASYVHILDLKTWNWTKITPKGTPPLKGSRACSSWLYKGKMYCFGGTNWVYEKDLSLYPSYLKTSDGTQGQYSNQLFCFNITTQCWEWPNIRGDVPQPRAWHSTVINESTIFLFGGSAHSEEGEEINLNDLHTLDMSNLRWKLVHGPAYDSSTFRVPSAREGQSLTWISQSAAILFGGLGVLWEWSGRLGDCWLLHLNQAEKSNDLSTIWTRIKTNNLQKRFVHTAVLEPLSQRLWLMGGAHCSKKLEKITTNVVPLKVLAMECIVGKMKSDDPMLNAAPKMLKKDIEAYRSSFDPESDLALPTTSEDEDLGNCTADAVLEIAAELLFLFLLPIFRI